MELYYYTGACTYYSKHKPAASGTYRNLIQPNTDGQRRGASIQLVDRLWQSATGVKLATIRRD
jgi:hypothetical protein